MPLYGYRINPNKTPPPSDYVSRHETRSSLKLKTQEYVDLPLPKAKTTEAIGQERVDVLNDTSALREFLLLQQQQVPTAADSRLDVVHVQELLDTRLQERQAKITGICPIRREVYSQCFDEVIRQVTIECDERGLLLSRIKNEIELSLSAYKTLYEGGVAIGMRKFLQAEQGKSDMEKRISDLENEKHNLTRKLEKQKAESNALENDMNEKQQLEKERLTEVTERLIRANEQLNLQLQGFNT